MDARRVGFSEPEAAVEDGELELTLGLSVGGKGASDPPAVRPAPAIGSVSPRRLGVAPAWSCSAEDRADLEAQAARSRARDRNARPPQSPCLSLFHNAAQSPNPFPNGGSFGAQAVPGAVTVHVPYGNGYGFSWVVPVSFWPAATACQGFTSPVNTNGCVDGSSWDQRTENREEEGVGMVSPVSGSSGISDSHRSAANPGGKRISRSSSSSCETRSHLTQTPPEEPHRRFSSSPPGRSDESISSRRPASPQPVKATGVVVGDEKNKEDKKPNALPRMPRVSATGSGPNGRTISGWLCRYSMTEVRILCSCHGSSFSPAEFVEHAGGSTGSNPLRQIVMVTP